jgi:hypothetical protein
VKVVFLFNLELEEELERRNGRIDQLLVELDSILTELATIEAGVSMQEVRILRIHPSFWFCWLWK